MTGGAGFIGSAFVRQSVASGYEVLNVDKLTYAADLRSLAAVERHPSYHFIQADVVDINSIRAIFSDYQPHAVFHLAAESHVDRSIEQPLEFVATNVTGTGTLLQVASEYWNDHLERNPSFRFVHISTDEVFGSLDASGRFTESSAYLPNSPYAASKAAADHLAQAWYATYDLPVIVTNCSNNYGPFQHPEKLVPTVIRSALAGTDIPIYGAGANVRDWLYVEDHVGGLFAAYRSGVPGRKYNFGADAEFTNLQLARMICAILDYEAPNLGAVSYAEQITFVEDRPGHDFRYAVDASRAADELGWRPTATLEQSLAKTVRWYLDNRTWWDTDEKSSGRLGIRG